MKPLVKGIIAAAVAAATSAAFSAGTESRNLSVSAVISGVCSLTTSGAMAFGTLNMSSSSDEVKTVTVTYKCATGNNVNNFSVGGSNTGTYNGTMTGLTPVVAPATANTLPYKITWDSTNVAYTGAGFSSSVPGKQIVLTGTIQNSVYTTKAPDSYADTVLLAIDY